MRLFILIMFFVYVTRFAFAGTCSSLSRTDYTYRQVLSSSDLNSDLNQLVSRVNDLDGGCVTNNTLELSSLNSSDFSAALNGITRGCYLKRENAASLSIGYCYASVNGNYVSTTATTNVAWANLDTGSEEASKAYYVYIQTGSTGSTLTPEISKTGPNGRGYNSAGDLAIGRFFNNNSSDIATGSVYSWDESKKDVIEFARITYTGSATVVKGGFLLQDDTSTGPTERSCYGTLGLITCAVNPNYFESAPICWANNSGSGGSVLSNVSSSSSWSGSVHNIIDIGQWDVNNDPPNATVVTDVEIFCKGKLSE